MRGVPLQSNQSVRRCHCGTKNPLSGYRENVAEKTSTMSTQLFWAKRVFRMGVGLLLLGLTAQTEFHEPFGLPTLIVAEGLLPATWDDLREEIETDRAIIARCRAQPARCSSQGFHAAVNPGPERLWFRGRVICVGAQANTQPRKQIRVEMMEPARIAHGIIWL